MLTQVIPPVERTVAVRTLVGPRREMLCIDMAVSVSLAAEGLAAILPFASEYTGRLLVVVPVKCPNGTGQNKARDPQWVGRQCVGSSYLPSLIGSWSRARISAAPSWCWLRRLRCWLRFQSLRRNWDWVLRGGIDVGKCLVEAMQVGNLALHRWLIKTSSHAI